MKKSIHYSHQLLFFLAIIMALTMFTYASPSINELSEKEAIKLATYYYAMNTQEDTIKFDKYAVTTLYDIDGNTTYYSVDFFLNNSAKGYVTIAGNLNYTQCVEFSLENSSKHFLDAKNGVSTIYYTPFNFFTHSHDSNVYLNQFGKKIAKKHIDGKIIKGSLLKNRFTLQSVTAGDPFNIHYQDFNTEDIIYFKGSFECHPKEYLSLFGYTFDRTTSFGSLESQMVAAGAFHPMYGEGSAPADFYSLTNVSNPNHCSITAISNILRYWRSICCSNYPSSYNSLFGTVAVQAESLGYFDRTAPNSYFNGNALDVMLATNRSYGYDGRGFSCYEADWGFLKTYIDNNWPIYMSIHDRTTFTEQTVMVYDTHAVVAFAYNVLQAYKDGEAYFHTFVKVFDGWGDYQVSPQDLEKATETDAPYGGGGVRYISWDMLEYYILPIEGEPIDVTMHAFCPYQI